MSRSLKHIALRRLAVLVAFLALWELCAKFNLLNPFYFPPPSKVWLTVASLFTEGNIWPHLEATFSAALFGLVLGILIGIVAGIAGALIPLLAEVIEPVMMLLNAIPRVILAPLFVIWLGIGLASKVAVAFVLVAVLMFFTVYTGIKEVDRRLIERVTTLGGGNLVLLREVYLPSLTAWVLGNLKVAVGFAFTGACVGEFVAASRGLGYLLSFAQSTYNAALTLALVLLIMIFVLVLFGVAGILEKYFLRWR